MNLKTLAPLAAGLLLSLPAWGVPARKGLSTLTQPDGSTVTVQRVGDEHRNFLLSSDGLLLTQDTDGLVTYGRLSTSGRIESTGVKALDPALRSSLPADVQPFSADLAMRTAPSPRRSLAQSGLGRFDGDFPRTGDVNVLVILVQYKDVKFTLSDPAAFYEDFLNKVGFSQYGATGSCKDYFRDQSLDQFRPHFDCYGPFTLSKNRSYYGQDQGDYIDLNAEEMIAEACRGLDSEIDFSRYDNDGDGYVDNVYVFYAGQGQASYGPASSIWPHSAFVEDAGMTVQLDGVRVDRYATSNEWEESRPDGIGTFVHEFSHVMGLPDLYTTDYGPAAYKTPGAYSVLDYGPYNNDGRTPPSYSAFERNAMGWIEPTLLSGPCSVTLQDIQTSNQACIALTDKTNEFFLFENRQQTGWDKYIPGHGMLVWHVDYNKTVFNNNVVNNTSSHQYVDIEEACGSADNENTTLMRGYPFPGSQGKSEFTASTRPAFKSWSGMEIDLPITAIAENGGVITFDVAGGQPTVATPAGLTIAEQGEDWVLAQWEEAEGASDYLLHLYRKSADALQTLCADMGNKATPTLPNGWNYSLNLEGYTSSGNYGQDSPSLKMSKDGAALTTCEYDSDLQALKFWIKGQQAEGSSLEVQGLVGEKWQTIETIVPEKLAVLTPEISSMPPGVRALKFIWHKSKGNLALDDIEITLGGAAERIHVVESTSGLTQARLENLQTGQYYFTTAATDGTFTSPHSAPFHFQIGNVSIEAIGESLLPALYFDLLGRPVSNPAPGQMLIEKRGNKASKRIFR